MLSRRAFLATSTTSVAVGAALPGCAAPARSITATPALPGPTATSSPHVELEEQTLAMLGGRLARGELTATTLLERYLARIEALDRSGPELRSVIELNPDAAAIAAQLDEERKAGKLRGPLHGLPILLKDNIDTGDKMLTSAGSLALDKPAPADAFLVTRLRAAGAVIFGKTNLSEWANIRSLRSTSGWSGRGGLTRNPYALDRNCSGSSSGSAAAVAANLCAAAVGSETDGSILSPSSICGLVGVKPTLGAISRRGMIPISHSQDTAGPMARTVEDAALLLAAMVGADPGDAATAAQPADLATQLLRGFTREALRGQRLGVVRKWSSMSDAVLGSFATAVEQLRELGAEIIELELPPMADLWDHELVVLLAELKANLATYLATRNLPFKSLADVIAFNQSEAGKELAWFGQDAFVKAEASPALTDAAYLEARALCLRQARDESLDALLDKNQLAALVFPSGGPAWLTDPLNGDAYTGGTSTLAAVAGYPSVTVPSGEIRGLPLGISFIGKPWSEATILGFAFAYEQASKARRTPGFLATLPLP